MGILRFTTLLVVKKLTIDYDLAKLSSKFDTTLFLFSQLKCRKIRRMKYGHKKAKVKQITWTLAGPPTAHGAINRTHTAAAVAESYLISS